MDVYLKMFFKTHRTINLANKFLKDTVVFDGKIDL